MTENHQVLLSLVGSALGNANVGLTCFKADWSELYTLASEQGVQGVVFSSLEKLLPETHPPKDILLKWIGDIAVMERTYTAYVSAIQEIAEVVNKEGFAMLLLKGYGCSLNYPRPSRRPCGDIDIFVMARDGTHTDDMVRRVNNALTENGKGRFIHDNSHHSVIRYGRFVVENHESILDTNSHKSSVELNKLLESLASDCLLSSQEMDGIVLPSVKFNTIHLLRHMANDFATVRTTLRHVLDWSTFVAKNDMDWNYVYEVMHRANMHRFLDAINSICVDFLGYDSGLFHIEKRNDKLRDRVLADILCPGFKGDTPSKSNELNYCWAKTCRMWHNRWKYSIVYDESLLSSFLVKLKCGRLHLFRAFFLCFCTNFVQNV